MPTKRKTTKPKKARPETMLLSDHLAYADSMSKSLFESANRNLTLMQQVNEARDNLTGQQRQNAQLKAQITTLQRQLVEAEAERDINHDALMALQRANVMNDPAGKPEEEYAPTPKAFDLVNALFGGKGTEVRRY